METREVFNTLLLVKGVYLQIRISPPILVSLPTEKKSPPLYDVGVLLGLRGIIHLLVKYKDGDERLILNINIKPPNLDSFKKC